MLPTDVVQSNVAIGVHAIDLALYLLEYPRVEAVIGMTRRAPEHDFDVEISSITKPFGDTKEHDG